MNVADTEGFTILRRFFCMGKSATASAIAQIKTVISGQNAMIATMNMVKMRSPSFTSSVIREDSMGVI